MWTCVLEKIDGKWLYLIERGWPKQPEENLLKVDGKDSLVKAELAIEKEVSQFINNSKSYAVKKQNVGINSNKTELLLTRAISLNPSNPRLFSARAKLYADQNRPKLAARDYFSFSELDLESDVESHEATIAWMDGAAAQVLAEDLPSYESYCLNMLRRFEGTEDTIVAERVAKSVLFQKAGKEALPMAKKMVDLAMKNDWPHARFVKGLANYRAGNFKAASNYAEECLSLPKRNVFLDIQANLLLAMASNAQGDSAKYKASLSKAKGHMENIKYYWFHNKVICQSLLSQAEKQ
jgi:tetratricopeptide (TPR) repeat protein